MIDLSEVTFIKRIVVGSSNPADLASEETIDRSMEQLNRCLAGPPRGRILGIERSFTLLQLGEHNVVLQWTTYHVGFTRRPHWAEE